MMQPLFLALPWVATPLILAFGFATLGLPRLLTGLTFTAGLAAAGTVWMGSSFVEGVLARQAAPYAAIYLHGGERQYLLVSFLVLFGLGGLCLMLHNLLSRSLQIAMILGFGLVYLGIGLGLLPALWLPQFLNGPDTLAAMRVARGIGSVASTLTILGQLTLLLILPTGALILLWRRLRQSPSARSGNPS